MMKQFMTHQALNLLHIHSSLPTVRTGDVDGDGEYEIIVKWTSSEHDVGSPGNPAYSGTVHLPHTN